MLPAASSSAEAGFLQLSLAFSVEAGIAGKAVFFPSLFFSSAVCTFFAEPPGVCASLLQLGFRGLGFRAVGEVRCKVLGFDTSLLRSISVAGSNALSHCEEGRLDGHAGISEKNVGSHPITRII